MKGIFVVSLLFLAVTQLMADDKLECYQCPDVTKPCEVSEATEAACGNTKTSQCQRQLKKGASDVTKAIRKCVVPDSQGKVKCTDGYECTECNEDLCNTGSEVKFTWIAIVGLLGSLLYLN